MPHLDAWWEQATFALRATFINLIQDIDASLPVLLLATSDTPLSQLPAEIQSLFSGGLGDGVTVELNSPTNSERRSFFEKFVEDASKRIVEQQHPTKRYPELPKAPDVIKPVEIDITAKKQQNAYYLRELRIFLRDCIHTLHRERRYALFFKPVV
jgi:hypothetical protein